MRARGLETALMLALGLTWAAAGPVDAAVKGGLYQGGFTTNHDETVDCTISFRRDNTLTFTEDRGSGPEAVEGTYTEFNLVLFTLWGGEVPDDSPDGTVDLAGIGILGLVATFYLDNPDADESATGFLYRIGPATRIRGR